MNLDELGENLQNNKGKEEECTEDEDDCIELVPYGVQVRYPYQLEVNEEDMNNAIISAKRIEQFIESIVR